MTDSNKDWATSEAFNWIANDEALYLQAIEARDKGTIEEFIDELKAHFPFMIEEDLADVDWDKVSKEIEEL